MAKDHTITDIATPEGPTPSGPPEPDLRRDIADELADHLELSARAKQLGGIDDLAAQQQALNDFGNPKQIATQLYLAAMKGTLMRQNVQTFAIITMAVAVIVLGVLSWSALRAGQQGMIDAMTVNNQAMLDALAAMGHTDDNEPNPQTNAPDAMEWGTLTVQLVGPNGEPFDSAGYKLSLNGKLLNRDENTQVQHTLESTNQHTFGPVRIGKHNLEIHIPGGLAYHNDAVTIWPGRGEHRIQAVCPTPDQFGTLPDIKVQIPDDLKHLSKDFVLMLHLEPIDHTEIYLAPDITVDGHRIFQHGSKYTTSTQRQSRWWLSTDRWAMLEPGKSAQPIQYRGLDAEVWQVAEDGKPRRYDLWNPQKASADLPYLKANQYLVRSCFILTPSPRVLVPQDCGNSSAKAGMAPWPCSRRTPTPSKSRCPKHIGRPSAKPLKQNQHSNPKTNPASISKHAPVLIGSETDGMACRGLEGLLVLGLHAGLELIDSAGDRVVSEHVAFDRQADSALIACLIQDNVGHIARLAECVGDRAAQPGPVEHTRVVGGVTHRAGTIRLDAIARRDHGERRGLIHLRVNNLDDR